MTHQLSLDVVPVEAYSRANNSEAIRCKDQDLWRHVVKRIDRFFATIVRSAVTPASHLWARLSRLSPVLLPHPRAPRLSRAALATRQHVVSLKSPRPCATSPRIGRANRKGPRNGPGNGPASTSGIDVLHRTRAPRQRLRAYQTP